MKKETNQNKERGYTYYKRETAKLLKDKNKKIEQKNLKKKYHIKTQSLTKLKENITKRLHSMGNFNKQDLYAELRRYYKREYELATGEYTSKRRDNFVKQYVKTLLANGVPIEEIENFIKQIDDENIDDLASTMPSIYTWASSDPNEMQDLNNQMNNEQYKKWKEQIKTISKKELERADIVKSRFYNVYKEVLEEEVEMLEEEYS